MNNYVELSKLSKVYPTPKGDAVIVKDFNLNIQKGEFITLIGHSGCGKSTVLSMLAGLNDISEGGIILAGKELSGAGPDRGVVFQSPSLLPWMTAYENVMLGGDFVFAPEFDEHLLEFVARERVEHPERLVEQKHLRLERKRAGDADTLPHALRQFSGLLVHGIREADDREIVFHDLASLLFARGEKNLFHGQHHILERRQPRQQARRLKDDAAIRPRPDEFPAGEDDAAARDVIQPGDHRKHGAFNARGVE